MQVLDILLCCGLTTQDPRLASLFCISRVSPKAFHYVQDTMLPNKASGPSYELLAGIAARSTSSVAWSPFRDPGMQEDADLATVTRHQRVRVYIETPKFILQIEHPALSALGAAQMMPQNWHRAATVRYTSLEHNKL